MTSISTTLNVDFIADLARTSGADDATIARLSAALEAHNAKPVGNPAFDLLQGKTSRAAAMLSRDCILSHSIAPDMTPPSVLMKHSTEILCRLLSGQWHIVAEEVNKITDMIVEAEKGANYPAPEPRIWARKIEGLCQLSQWLQAHRAACVLACSLDDCALRECTETRCDGKAENLT